MKCSIVTTVYNKENAIGRTLESIFKQNPPFEFEVLVVDDGSTDNSKSIIQSYPVRYFYLDRPEYTNPAKARNIAYRECKGEVVITQSSEIEHRSDNLIELMVNTLEPGMFNLATVFNVNEHGKILNEVTGKKSTGTLLFLGSLFREDLYKVKGDSELFTEPGSEDVWFLWCLTEGLGLRHKWLDEAIGYHYDHPRPKNTNHPSMKQLVREMLEKAKRGEIPFEGSL